MLEKKKLNNFSQDNAENEEEILSPFLYVLASKANKLS